MKPCRGGNLSLEVNYGNTVAAAVKVAGLPVAAEPDGYEYDKEYMFNAQLFFKHMQPDHQKRFLEFYENDTLTVWKVQVDGAVTKVVIRNSVDLEGPVARRPQAALHGSEGRTSESFFFCSSDGVVPSR